MKELNHLSKLEKWNIKYVNTGLKTMTGGRVKRIKKYISDDKNFLAGLNVYKGQVTYKAVADVFGHNYLEPEKAILN